MYKVGTSGNPNGRPKGATNKITSDMRQILKSFFADNIEQMKDEFAKMDAKDKFLILERLLPYILPKLKDVEGTFDGNKLTLDFDF